MVGGQASLVWEALHMNIRCRVCDPRLRDTGDAPDPRFGCKQNVAAGWIDSNEKLSKDLRGTCLATIRSEMSA